MASDKQYYKLRSTEGITDYSEFSSALIKQKSERTLYILVNTLFHENNAMKWNIQMQILRANPFVFELDSYRVSNAIYFFLSQIRFHESKSCSFRNPSETLRERDFSQFR